jgi:hypothetical protein
MPKTIETSDDPSPLPLGNTPNSGRDVRAAQGEEVASPAEGEPFIRVSEAKRRYLGGVVSLRWWYRQIEEGRLPHFRAGTAVILRIADVEAFVAEMYRDKQPPQPDPPQPVPAAPARRSRPAGGLRFFADNG